MIFLIPSVTDIEGQTTDIWRHMREEWYKE